MAIINPEWAVKEIGSIQSVQEMNALVNAVKNNADELLSLSDNSVKKFTKINNKSLEGDIVLDKADINLQYVDNTSDLNKPVSNLTKQELDKKANNNIQINGHQLNSNITISKEDIGLPKVDNTSDLEKPVSTAQSSAIGAVNLNITYHKNDKANPHNVTKEQIGLPNVNDTSDINKPISIAQQTALNKKADLVNGLIPANQLPSYVDDIVEFQNKESFPGVGEQGKIYVDLNDNLTYRWSGSIYTEISKSIKLGETNLDAYPGDKGKQIADNLLSLYTKGYIFIGHASTQTTPNVYGINDRVYYILDMPINLQSVTLNNFSNIVIPALVNRTRYLIMWNGSSWNANIDNRFITMDELNSVDSNLQESKADKSINIIAGNGLSGGGSLYTDRIIDINSEDDGIIINNDNIKLNIVNDLTTVSSTRPVSSAQTYELQKSKVNNTGNETISGVKTFNSSPIVPTPTTDMQSSTKKYVDDSKNSIQAKQVIAGNGLTGGGTLSADRTLNIVSANDGITVNADNIQLNPVDNVTTTSITQPLAANQGKVLNDSITQLGADLNENIEPSLAEILNAMAGRIIALESIIKNSVYKNMQVDTLDIVKGFSIYGSTNLVLTGTAAPSVVPDFVGQFYVNTTGGVCYQAKGISSTSDWKQTSN